MGAGGGGDRNLEGKNVYVNGSVIFIGNIDISFQEQYFTH